MQRPFMTGQVPPQMMGRGGQMSGNNQLMQAANNAGNFNMMPGMHNIMGGANVMGGANQSGVVNQMNPMMAFGMQRPNMANALMHGASPNMMSQMGMMPPRIGMANMMGGMNPMQMQQMINMNLMQQQAQIMNRQSGPNLLSHQQSISSPNAAQRSSQANSVSSNANSYQNFESRSQFSTHQSQFQTKSSDDKFKRNEKGRFSNYSRQSYPSPTDRYRSDGNSTRNREGSQESPRPEDVRYKRGRESSEKGRESSERERYSSKRSRHESDSNHTSDVESDSKERGSHRRSQSPRRYKRPYLQRNRDERHRSSSRYGSQDRGGGRDRDRDSGRDHRGGGRDRGSDRERDRGGAKELEREANRAPEREGDMGSARERDKAGDRGIAKDRGRDGDRSNAKDRGREGDGGGAYGREGERGSTKERDRVDERDSRRDRSRREYQRLDSADRKPVTKERSSSKERSSARDDVESVDDTEDVEENEDLTPKWVRCSPADLYFTNNHTTGCVEATKKMKDLEDLFDTELVQWSARAKAQQTEDIPPHIPHPTHTHHHHHHHGDSHQCESSSGSDSDSSSDSDEEVNARLEELERKKKHPHILHQELWYNEAGQVNDGPLCRCSLKSQKTGIRHNIYPGEKVMTDCNKGSNNKDKLFHYRVAMSPPINYLTKCPTIIEFDNHEYIFEGFSIMSHYKLDKFPICRVIRFNIEYTIHFIEEPMPENFTVRSLDLFTKYLFNEILELIDIDWSGPGANDKDACHIMHLMPRFSRSLPENGKEVLSMNEVLSFLIKKAKILIDPVKLPSLLKLDASQWQELIDTYRGMIVIYPGKRPVALRIDQLDRSQPDPNVISYPLIIHFGSRPAQLCYVGDPAYQRMWKQYIKFRHLLSSKPKVLAADKLKLHAKEQALQEVRTKSTMKREVTVEISSEGFICTGLKSDISQERLDYLRNSKIQKHAMLIPVLLGHLRFHKCLSELESLINYQFTDKYLLQLALTHTSYRVNYGTNPDHARNTLANAGRRQVEYGSRKVPMQNTRKRGLNTLIDIMSRMGKTEEVLSDIPHNERLEFLGDAVVEFLSSVHLFYMFPWLEEGGLSTYRTAIVQNQHLAILAKKLRLQEFMLYAHGPDLCHEYDLRHAMANCFEALMGALFIDGGIELADRIFGETLFGDNANLLATWKDVPHHPLQEDQPEGDRQWIESSHILQKILKFEESLGVEFDHIRILARAFTPRNVGYTNLTLGHNQRLEFLGDTVLQLIASEYLFKHFPEHHEGHLTLLRSSLVNNRTQSIVCDDLGMTEYVIYDRHIRDRGQLKTKEKADLLEAFIGALYVDKDLDYCRVFCEVCFFPRLQDFILNQDWNDPKSQLQQCCLTLRELDGGEPDIPIYKVIESKGPTNTRMYVVAVYFRGERLATGEGHSIQQAEMSAATNAMNIRQELFPIILHQKRFLENRYRHLIKPSDQKADSSSESSSQSHHHRYNRSRSRSTRPRHKK